MKVEWSSVPMEAGLKYAVVELGAKFQQEWSAHNLVPAHVSLINLHA